jgi:hypothetical protein
MGNSSIKDPSSQITNSSFSTKIQYLLQSLNVLYNTQQTKGIHEFFADIFVDMGFYPCKGDPDVWMKDCGTHYEYVCVYVDDLACVRHHPSLFFCNSGIVAISLRELGRSLIILEETFSGILMAHSHGEPARPTSSVLPINVIQSLVVYLKNGPLQLTRMIILCDMRLSKKKR